MAQARLGVSSGNDLDVNQLYALALMQGGAVADRAMELRGEKSGIFATASNSIKNSFSTFFNDILPAADQVVAGIIDPNKTIGQALEENLTPSEALYGSPDTGGGWASKGGAWTYRMATDVLLSPLTYANFIVPGSGVAIKAAGAAAKINIAREALAAGRAEGLVGKELMTFVKSKKDETIDLISKETGMKFDEAVNKLSLNKEGLNKKLEFTQSMIDGRRESFLAREADNVWREAKKSGNPISVDEAKLQVNNLYDEGVYKIQTKVSKLGKAEYSLVKQEGDSLLTKMTMEAPIDSEEVARMMGRMFTQNPALYSTWIEKGGLQYFGKTILSAQRISKTSAALAKMTRLDKLTEPVRKFVSSSYTKFFTTHINNKSKVADLGTLEKASDLIYLNQRLIKNKVYNEIHSIALVAERLGITERQWELIAAGINDPRVPADPLAAEIWKLAHGYDYDKDIVPENVTKGLRLFQRKGATNLKEAHASGIRINDMTTKDGAHKDGYVHYFLKEETKRPAKISGRKINPDAAKQRETGRFTKYNDDENYQIGHSEALGLQPANIQARLKETETVIKSTERNFGAKLNKLNREVIKLNDTVQKVFSKKATAEFSALLKTVPERNMYSVNAAMKVFKESLPKLNYKKMVEEHKTILANSISKAEKVLSEADPETIKKIEALVESSRSKAGEFVEDVNKSLAEHFLELDDEVIKKFSRDVITTTKKEGTKVPNISTKLLTSIHQETMNSLVKSGINSSDLAKFTDNLVQHFEENPNGVKRLLGTIAGKESKIVKLTEEMSQRLFDLKKQKGELSDMADYKMYVNDKNEFFRKSQASFDELRSAGFDFEQNGALIMAKSSTEILKTTGARDLLEDIAQNCGVPQSEALQGWREVDMSLLTDRPSTLSDFLTSSKGEKLLYHPDLADKMEELNKLLYVEDDIQGALKVFDDMTNLFKVSATTIFPQFHGMNSVSGVIQNFYDMGLAAFNPARNVMAAQIVRNVNKLNELRALSLSGDTKAAKELLDITSKQVFTDKTGYSWTLGELESVLKTYDVAFTDQFSGRIDIRTGKVGEMLEDMQVNLFRPVTKLQKLGKNINPLDLKHNIAYRTGGQVGENVENFGRVLNFVYNLEKTGDMGVAASRTKMFQFDYANLSKFERDYMKRIIPFYPFIRKNIELQARTLVTNPGRINQVGIGFKTLNDVLDGDELTTEEYNNLPSYLRNKFSVVSKIDGSKVYVYSGFQMPIEQVFQMIQPNLAIASTNPIVRLPLELMTGYSAFSGGMIDPHTNARALENAPDWIKEAVGYIGYEYKTSDGQWHKMSSVLNPKLYYAIRNFPVGGRLFAQSLTYKNMAATDKAFEDYVLNTFSTIQEYDLDLNVSNAIENKKLVKELQDLLIGQGTHYRMNRLVESKTSRPLQ